MENSVKATRVVRLRPGGLRKLYARQERPYRSMRRGFRSKHGHTFHVFLDLLEESGRWWVYAISVAEGDGEERELLGFIEVNSSRLACDEVDVFFREHKARPVEAGWRGAGPQFKIA